MRLALLLSFVALFAVATSLAPWTQSPSADAAARRGEDVSDLINQALARPVDMDLDDADLPAVIESIGQQTGVTIKAGQDVYDLLPWGRETKVSAEIANQNLRQALATIAGRLGLTFEVTEQDVQLRPTPALERIGRRADEVELEALAVLAGNELGLDPGRVSIEELLQAVDAKLAEVAPRFAVENRTVDTIDQQKVVTVARNATLADALEAMARETAATWQPWQENVLVLTKEDHIAQQLERQINERYNDVDVTQVLSELSQRSGVDFEIEPGAVQRIPSQFRTVRLELEGVSIRRVLNDIAGFTGLSYEVTPTGVRITNKGGSAAAGGSQDPVVGMIRLEGGMELLLRESQVPEDVRAYLEHKRQQAVEDLRKQMEAEEFTPPAKEGAGEEAEDL